MLLLPLKSAESNRNENPHIKGIEGKGDPILKETAVMMRQLHLARVRTVSNTHPDMGIDHGREPELLYFNIKRINEFLKSLDGHAKNNHLAVCLALTIINEETGLPVAPNPEQIGLMKAAIEFEQQNQTDKFLEIIKALGLVQTVILVACDENGTVFVDEKSAFAYYDFAGQCCRTGKKFKDKDDEEKEYNKKVDYIKNGWQLV